MSHRGGWAPRTPPPLPFIASPAEGTVHAIGLCLSPDPLRSVSLGEGTLCSAAARGSNRSRFTAHAMRFVCETGGGWGTTRAPTRPSWKPHTPPPPPPSPEFHERLIGVWGRVSLLKIICVGEWRGGGKARRPQEWGGGVGV